MPRRGRGRARFVSQNDLMAPNEELGKFEGEPLLTEILWNLVLEGSADEELGESEDFGAYALFLHLKGSEVNGDIGDTKAAILFENSQGFVSGTYYDSIAEARDEWDRLEDEYDEFIGDEEEEE
jgi:hypothetical protein